MSTKAKWIITIILITVAVVGAWYFSVGDRDGSMSTTSNTEPIRIGGIIMQTGDAAEYGASEMQSIELATEEINKNGGILGRPIKFVLEDSKCAASEGATAASKLINIDKVDLVISFECSGPSISGSKVAEQNKKLFIVGMASAPGIAKNGGDYIWRVAPADDVQGRDLAAAVLGKGNKKIAVIFINNDYGAGIEKVFEENVISGGAKLVAKESFADKDSDFKTQLTKIKQARPDALVMLSMTNQYPLIIKQAKSLDLEASLFASETMKDDKLIRDLGRAADGIIFTSYNSPSSEERTLFVEKIKAKFGNEPGIYADFAYDAIYTVKQAIEKAGKVDTEAVKVALKATRLQGATGLTEFDQDREVKNKEFSLYTIEDGKVRPFVK